MRRSALKQRGIVLIVVVIGLALLASIALMLTSSTGIDNALVRNQAENATLDYLAESGMVHASWQLAKNSSCANYTALASTAFGDHSYSATLTPTAGSPVTIIATGTLNTGTSRALTRNFVTAYQAPNSVTLQPGSEGIDTFLWDGAHKDTNFGATDYVSIDNIQAERTILIKFDLSGLPANALIESAVLELWVRAGVNVDNGVVDAHRVSRSWVEGEYDDQVPVPGAGATYQEYDGQTAWTNTGGDYDPTVLDSVTIPTAIPAWYAWDITESAQAWYSGSQTNDGVLLRGSSGVANKIDFTSSDNVALANRPKLTITYSCECGVVCGGSGDTTFETRIADSSDDAEQRTGDGYVDAASSDLELADDVDGSQTNLVGMRFQGVAVPQGATIFNAYIQFQVDEPKSGVTNLSVIGQNIDNADQFTTTDYDISDRAPTAASVPWVVPVWNTVGQAGPDQQTPNIAGIVQEIVNRPGWSSGSSLVIMVAGAGTRTAEAYDGDPGAAPLLHIEYSGGGGGGGGQYYLDQLNAIAYDGNDGTLDWTGDWQEVGESDGPTAGFLRVANDANCSSSTCLRIGHADSDVTQRILYRAADLSGNTSWTMSYDYATSNADRGYLHVEVSSDGGSNWSPLTTYDFDNGDVSGSGSFDLAGFVSSNSQIRFRLANRDNDAGRREQIRGLMYMDNVKIEPGDGADSLLPLAHWKLDDASGTIAVDSVGGHDGSLINGPTWDIGKIEGALDFDGNNDHINVPHHDSLSLTDAMTFTAWVNASSYNTRYQTIIAKDRGGSNSNFWFGTYERDLVFGFYSGGFFREEFTPGQNLQSGTWHHLAASFDNATGEVRLYADGIEVHSGTFSFSASADNADLQIGVTPDGEYWPGLLDDVRIYDEVLAASAIAELAAGGSGGGGSCDGRFRDQFDEISFSGSDGDFLWAGPWLEIGESDGAAAGDVRVMNDDNDFQLRIRDNNNGGEGVEREADLSGAASAQLSYEYRRMNLDTSSDYVGVEISGNGASGPWVELTRHEKDNDADYESDNHDISDYISANTRIRFVSSSTMGNTDTVWFDDVRIDCSP